jgi:hypothetical protein
MSKTRERQAMPQGFQQQDHPLRTVLIPHSAAKAQHGQKASKIALKVNPPRSFDPKPGH